MKPFFLSLILSLTVNSEVLRLSHVVPEAGEGISRFEISHGDHKEMIFVKNQPIVTTADVAAAHPSLLRDDSVSVALSDEGGKKIFAATKAMRHGIDRIAIIVDGKVKSAPIVHSTLGKNFEISGLNAPDEPLKLAGRMSGKSEDEIAKIKAKNEKMASERPSLPDPVFHTEQEYQQLKTQRAKMGLHYMDRVYTEAELDQLLKKGMSQADVIAIFGKPYLIDSKEKTKELTFTTAPEKHPVEKQYHMTSFIVEFTSEKVTKWRSYIWSARTREPKKTQRIPDNLIHKAPAIDLSSNDFDMIDFVGKYEISLKQGETKPTIPDYYDLISIAWLAASSTEEGKSIDATCDVITLLKPTIPNLDALTKKAPKGRIAVADLKAALQPYIYGDETIK